MKLEIHEALKEKLNSNTECFQSYKEALLWTNTTYNTDFKYSWFRYYLIKHFGSKLKVPRKSHVKKDPNAVAIFLKSYPPFLGV